MQHVDFSELLGKTLVCVEQSDIRGDDYRDPNGDVITFTTQEGDIYQLFYEHD